MASKFSIDRPGRIHQLVAAGAGRVRAVLRHPLAHREHAAFGVGVLQRRHVGRRRRRRRAEDVLENPLAAQDRRRAVGVRGHRQDAAVAEQAAAHAGLARARRGGTGCRRRWGCRSAWPAARSRTCSWRAAGRARCGPRGRCSAKNSSVSRRNAWRRLSSKSGNCRASGLTAARLRRYSHWPAKLVTSASARRSASMRRTCRSSTSGCDSRARDRHVQQLVVGNAAPQEERQARGQLHVADAIRRLRRRARRVALDAEQELGAREHRAQRHLDAGVEVRALARASLVEAHRRLDVGGGHRPAERAAGERGDDPAARTHPRRRRPPGGRRTRGGGWACRRRRPARTARQSRSSRAPPARAGAGPC